MSGIYGTGSSRSKYSVAQNVQAALLVSECSMAMNGCFQCIVCLAAYQCGRYVKSVHGQSRPYTRQQPVNHRISCSVYRSSTSDSQESCQAPTVLTRVSRPSRLSPNIFTKCQTIGCVLQKTQ